jgi:hypothetical protein
MAKEGKAWGLNENEFNPMRIITQNSPFALRNIALI